MKEQLLYKIKSACFIYRLTFTVLLGMMVQRSVATEFIMLPDSMPRIMTVAKVYEEKYSDPGTIRVTFYESARFYKLPKSNAHFSEYITLLKEALAKQQPVQVWFTEPQGDIIDKVSKAKKKRST